MFLSENCNSVVINKNDFFHLISPFFILENVMDHYALLETARKYSQKNEFGKSCSYYLYLFKGEPSFCHTVQDEFMFVVHCWLSKLISLNKMKEVFSFIETSVTVCRTIKMELLLASSQAFFTSGLLLESTKLLIPLREKCITNFQLEETIDHLHNMLIDRWHFRMLNDQKRNMAYAAALEKAFKRGHRCIIDIGSGSGIFSLVADKIGFDKIYSCEASEVMCDIQNKCFDANNSTEHVQVINEYSTNINIDDTKPTLIVTEIFDCGLLGEGVLPVLIDAHERLVETKHVEIIPNSAVIYGVCIECNEIRKHSSHSTSNGFMLYGSKDPGDEIQQQPYTTEYMAGIKGGYKELSNPFVLKSINFNCLTELKEVFGTSELLKVPIISAGRFDAVMVYFNLNVDSVSEINTLDKDGLCWEQAIYNIMSPNQLEVGCEVQLNVTYAEEYLDINFVDQREEKVIQDLSKSKNTKQNEVLPIDRRLVARFNDNNYVKRYHSSLSTFFSSIDLSNTNEFNVCILCPEVTIIPLFLKQYNFINVYLLEPSSTTVELLQADFPNGKLNILLRDKLNESSITFHLVLSEPIDCGGLIVENFIEDLISIKRSCCSSKTKFIPSKIDIHGCCVSSNRLICENRVLKENIPYDLNLVEFMNNYKVKNHPDIDGCQVTEILSDKKFLCCINLQEDLTDKSLSFHKTTVDFKLKKSGNMTGLIYWYDVVLNEGEVVTTEPSVNSHWYQACCFFHDQNQGHVDELVSLLLCRNNSNLHFSIC